MNNIDTREISSKNVEKIEYAKQIMEIEQRRDFVLNNLKILAQVDNADIHWKELLELTKKDYFFETYMVINWLGSRFRPKKILEIGTRTGGSLISLLSTYQYFDDLEVICFDLWREFPQPLQLPDSLSYAWGKLLGKLPFIPKTLSILKVRKNLKIFNIPIHNIKFISGDSRITVPRYFQENPFKKFDYVLVDGGHDRKTAWTDLENVANHIAKGGALVFDDIGEGYQLIDVWNNFKDKHKTEFEYFENFHRKGVAWAFKVKKMT